MRCVCSKHNNFVNSDLKPFVLSIIDWHCWQNIINMLHDGRANGKGIGKNVAGDNEKWRKAPTHHLSYRSATSWQFTSWINSFMVIWSGRNWLWVLLLVVVTAPYLTHHFRFTATAPTERHHNKNITYAQPLVMPSAHVAHAPILYWRLYREQGLSLIHISEPTRPY